MAPYLDELDAAVVVASALAAHGKKDWKVARGLLEAALDRYAATTPVIVEHAPLSEALRDCLAGLGKKQPAGPRAPSPLPDALRQLVVLPRTRLSPARPRDLVDAYMAQPLHRRSPTLLGLDHWEDYIIHLRWSFEKGDSFVLLFRVSERRAGQFAYYALCVEARRLLLGLVQPTGVKELTSRTWRPGPDHGQHRLFVNLRGSEIVAKVDGTYVLRTSDSSLHRGNIGLATTDAQVLIDELSVLFPLSGPRRE